MIWISHRITGSVTERAKTLVLQQLWLHVLDSTRTLVTLLSPWLRRFTIRGAGRNFFRGRGASDASIIYKINYNLIAASRVLLRGLDQKFKWSCSKHVAIDRHVERTDAIQLYYGRRSGGSAPSRLAIFAISFKKYHFNVIWITFRTFLRPLERTKLLRLGIYLKFLNCWSLSAFYNCKSNSNHV